MSERNIKINIIIFEHLLEVVRSKEESLAECIDYFEINEMRDIILKSLKETKKYGILFNDFILLLKGEHPSIKIKGDDFLKKDFNSLIQEIINFNSPYLFDISINKRVKIVTLLEKAKEIIKSKKTINYNSKKLEVFKNREIIKEIDKSINELSKYRKNTEMFKN